MSKDPNPHATGPTKWRAERCVTHHHACDCREWEHATRVAELERDAERWREICDKAWFVDQAAFVYGLRSGSFAPTVDPDEVWAAIDAAMST